MKRSQVRRRPNKADTEVLTEPVSPSATQTLVEELSKVPEIEYVLYGREGSVSLVVSVINEFDPIVRHRIYEKQKIAAARLPGIAVDFYVRARENRDPEEFLPTDLEVIYQRDRDAKAGERYVERTRAHREGET